MAVCNVWHVLLQAVLLEYLFSFVLVKVLYVTTSASPMQRYQKQISPANVC